MEQARKCEEERGRLRPGGGREGETHKMAFNMQGKSTFPTVASFLATLRRRGQLNFAILQNLAEIGNSGFIGPPNPPSVFL